VLQVFTANPERHTQAFVLQGDQNKTEPMFGLGYF
jgi:hypothetical protein